MYYALLLLLLLRSRVIAGIEWRLIGIFRVRDLPNITFEINTLMFLNKINEYVVGRIA